MVRSFLADWLYTRPADAPVPNWTPLLPTKPIEFSYFENLRKMKWECQCLLQNSVSNMDRCYQDMLSSPQLIMLFILGFPAVKKEDLISGYSYSFDFMTAFAPQNIKVNAEPFNINGERKIRLELVAAESVEHFAWADWIDSAMGFLKGVDDLVAVENPRDVPDRVVNWRKRTPKKFDPDSSFLIVHQKDPDVPSLPGCILIWMAWPMFDIKVVQFEMNQWMQKTNLMHGFGDAVTPKIESWDYDDHREVDRAESGLLKIMEWNRR